MHTSFRHKLIAAAAALGVTSFLLTPQAAQASPSHLIRLPVAGGVATVDVDTLEVTANARGDQLELSAPAEADLGPARSITRHRNRAVTWTYPRHHLDVTVAAVDGRLVVTTRSGRDQSLTWPVTGTDPATSAIAFPRGEGQHVPVTDPFWNSPDGLADVSLDLMGGLQMPFWGYTIGDRGVSYIVPTDIRTTLAFRTNRGRLHTATTHDFDGRADTRKYQVSFALTDASPIASGLDYRRWLIAHDGLKTLQQKIAANRDVAKLLGAFHAYLWGDALEPSAMTRLRRAGITRMWLGDATDVKPLTDELVAAAERAGYLIGPYDTWDNAQDPATADTPTSVWPDNVWPDFCIRNADGSIRTGFHGRGCYVSTQAFAQAEPVHHYLAQRVDTMTAAGPNSYFLDVDSAGQLFDDYSPDHPMNQAQDQRNRLARMGWLSSTRHLVLGGESAVGWANPVLSFSHGSSTPAVDQLWPLERDRQYWGGWWPPERPNFFFKPVTLPPDVAKAMFDPTYRIPLYETVLHDSVVSLDRWELSYIKLPDLKTTRALLAMLYNTPLNLVLDGQAITDRADEIAALQRYFAPLHRAAGTKPLTDFRWLTPDHLVQQTRFGHGTLTVTANFGETPYQGLPPGCVTAHLSTDDHSRRLCPATLD